ncbi:GntR family transcriptional regulator [Microlunatus sp. GCM10028923]|uniref:GntR family transcriptional regulator n=1 Tax=Microlunatus sp. GCM10028923 TaxID=3273400 RepID=UPI003608EB76
MPEPKAVLPRLRAEILTGVLKPGDPVNEVKLAERYGVSPTPVREAVWQLISEGYIEGGRNRRRRVMKLSPERGVGIVELLGVLIPAALERAGRWAPGVELDRLADGADAMANSLDRQDPGAVIGEAVGFVDLLAETCRQPQLGRQLNETVRRAGSLILFPAEVWTPWSGWSAQLRWIATALRDRQLRLAASAYTELMTGFADRMRAVLPQLAEGPDRPPEAVGRTRHEEVVEQLQDDILSGVLKPGDPVRETEISARLGVSSTPVREAIRVLIAVGLIDGQPHRTRRVSVLSAEEYLAAVDLLRLLQTWLLPRALGAMSEEDFGGFIARAELAAERFEQDDPAGLPPAVFEMYEELGRHGNHEVAAAFVSSLRRTLPYWRSYDLAPHRHFTRALASLQYPVRIAGAAAAIDRLNRERPADFTPPAR